MEYHVDDEPPRPMGDPGLEKMGRGARLFDLVERECRFVWPKRLIVSGWMGV
jgi:hypothetical protein